MTQQQSTPEVKPRKRDAKSTLVAVIIVLIAMIVLLLTRKTPEEKTRDQIQKDFSPAAMDKFLKDHPNIPQ